MRVSPCIEKRAAKQVSRVRSWTLKKVPREQCNNRNGDCLASWNIWLALEEHHALCASSDLQVHAPDVFLARADTRELVY